jgi:hypothetical protein
MVFEFIPKTKKKKKKNIRSVRVNHPMLIRKKALEEIWIIQIGIYLQHLYQSFNCSFLFCGNNFS